MNIKRRFLIFRVLKVIVTKECYICIVIMSEKRLFPEPESPTLLERKARMQREALRILEENKFKYRVSIHTGTVYIRTKFPLEEELKPVLANTTWRYKLSGNRGQMVNIPAHVLIWIVANGEFDPRNVVGHRDKNPENNAIENLFLKGEHLQLVEFLEKVTLPPGTRPKNSTSIKLKNARYEEIVKIKKLKAANPKMTNIEISERLNVKLSSVKRVTNAMKTGKALKYERPGPYPSPNSFVERWKSEKAVESDF